MTRLPTPLLSVLCLSLFSGCSGPSSDSLSHAPSNIPHIVSSSRSAETATAGQPLTFEVSASNPQGGALSFSWSATTGTLGTPSGDDSTSRVTWTAPSCAAASPSPTVTVTNSSHLSSTQDFPVQGLPACGSAPATSIPHITAFSHSAETAEAGQQLSFEATAVDPQGGSLTFFWGASSGTLGMPSSEGSTSRVTWTAPACAIVGLPPRITVYVKNPVGQSEIQSFTVSGLPACPSKWSVLSDMRSAHLIHTAALLKNGKVLVAGGNAGATASGSPTPAELYDPTTRTWSQTDAVHSPGDASASVLLSDGRVFVWSGDQKTSLYDPATNTWSETASMLHPHSGGMVTRLSGDKVLVSAGGSNTDSKSAELYDPATDTWSPTGSPSAGRASPASLLLPDGRVLVVGGGSLGDGTASVCLKTAEVYDPATGAWSTTGAMSWSRCGPTAILLPNGKVLVSGGGTTEYTDPPVGEEYDPATGTWSVTGAMNWPRHAHQPVLMPDGRVLVMGGGRFSPRAESLAMAEFYDPATRTWSATDAMPASRIFHTATLLATGQVLVVGGMTDDADGDLSNLHNYSKAYVYTP